MFFCYTCCNILGTEAQSYALENVGSDSSDTEDRKKIARFTARWTFVDENKVPGEKDCLIPSSSQAPTGQTSVLDTSEKWVFLAGGTCSAKERSQVSRAMLIYQLPHNYLRYAITQLRDLQRINTLGYSTSLMVTILDFNSSFHSSGMQVI